MKSSHLCKIISGDYAKLNSGAVETAKNGKENKEIMSLYIL
jgi:hypothetical protein